MYPIAGKQELTAGIYSLEVEAPLVAAKVRPGHFVVLRVWEHGERIPLTVVGADPERGRIRLIFQVVGKSTMQLAGLQVGDALPDLLGPLGHVAAPGKVGTVLMVGGGVGTAPVLPRAREYKADGNRVISVVGARSKDLLILRDEMTEASDEIHFCTDDGSFGHHGLVTDLIPQIKEREGSIAEVLAIGPVPMMRATCRVTAELGLKTIVSLNALMVDGTGMCGACRVTVGGRIKFTCVDGPEFDGHAVDFVELGARLRQYLVEEKSAVEHYHASKEGKCECLGE